MFGFKDFIKKEKKSTGSESTSSSQAYETPVHTMEDDLKSLDGSFAIDKSLKKAEFDNLTRKGQLTETGQQPNNKPANPFLPETTPSQIPSKVSTAPSPPANNKLFSFLKLNQSRILLGVVMVLAVSVLGLGAYFFFKVRHPSKENGELKTEKSPSSETPQKEEVPVIIEPPSQKYSTDLPNQLALNRESANSAEIKNLLLQISLEIREGGIDKMVEFRFTDQDFNPLPFHVFLVLAEINFSPITENLGDNFSLFIYPGSEGMRIALVVEVKNREAALQAILQKEATLVSDLGIFFLNETPFIENKPFGANEGFQFPIRYKNLDYSQTGSLALDYALTESHLIIATSKNLMLEMMKKYTSPKQTTGSH